MLLVNALAQGDQVELSHCTRCHCAILLDRYGNARLVCAHCRHDRTQRPDEEGEGEEKREEKSTCDKGDGGPERQRSLF